MVQKCGLSAASARIEASRAYVEGWSLDFAGADYCVLRQWRVNWHCRARRTAAPNPSLEMHVDDNEVRALFRQAIAHDDEIAMRQGIEQLLGLSDGGRLSAEQEYAVRHPDYVMEMPQSNERIRGRDGMRAMQEAYPTPPGVRLRRVHGSGRTWVIEGVNDYDGDVWNVVLILELDEDGRILRDTRYYGQRSAPPEWRSRWVEPIE